MYKMMIIKGILYICVCGFIVIYNIYRNLNVKIIIVLKMYMIMMNFSLYVQRNQSTVLHSACHFANIDSIEYFIKKGLSLEAHNQVNLTSSIHTYM